jgi:hypothetical protein
MGGPDKGPFGAGGAGAVAVEAGADGGWAELPPLALAGGGGDAPARPGGGARGRIEAQQHAASGALFGPQQQPARDGEAHRPRRRRQDGEGGDARRRESLLRRPQGFLQRVRAHQQQPVECKAELGEAFRAGCAILRIEAGGRDPDDEAGRLAGAHPAKGEGQRGRLVPRRGGEDFGERCAGGRGAHVFKAVRPGEGGRRKRGGQRRRGGPEGGVRRHETTLEQKQNTRKSDRTRVVSQFESPARKRALETAVKLPFTGGPKTGRKSPQKDIGHELMTGVL